MTIDYASFARASTLIHVIQGAALLLLGVAEACTLTKPGNKAELTASLALLLAGVGSFFVILALPGSWSFGQMLAALAERRGFYVFIAFSCLFAAAGLSRLMEYAMGKQNGGWQKLFVFLVAMIGVLYLLLPGRVNEEAFRQVLVPHAFIGGVLLAAVLFKAAHFIFEKKALHIAWAALLVAASFQLFAYRETPDAFGVRSVTLELGPGAALPAAENASIPVATKNNAAPAAKKRTHN